MAAFGNPWGDIDRTQPGQPYVADSDGWGWFALLIMLALPFFVMGILLMQMTEAICKHPYISFGTYLVFSFVFGLIFYSRGNKKFKLAGIAATMITLLPFALTEAFYMVPYIVQHALFASVFEWLIVTAILGGITFFILSIANLLENGWIHLILAVIFFAIVFAVLNHFLSSSDQINWALVSTVYQWK
jgi:hypothetical protein